MDWMNWKTWASIAVILVVSFAIYSFASPETQRVQTTATVSADLEANDAKKAGNAAASAPLPANIGFEPVHKEWIEPQPGAYKSERNLFAYKEPPPPPSPSSAWQRARPSPRSRRRSLRATARSTSSIGSPTVPPHGRGTVSRARAFGGGLAAGAG